MDVCGDHSKLVEKVGTLTGKIELVVSGISEIKTSIESLHNKVNTNVIDTAVQKTKLSPLVWIIMAIGTIAINLIVRAVW